MRRLGNAFIVALAVLVVLLDATVWRWLTWLGARLGHLAPIAWLERMIERLSPGWVIALFVLPFVPIIPLLKFGEFWLLAHGHYLTAILLIIGSKVVGAAFSTRIFAIARPKMLQVRWFAASLWLADRRCWRVAMRFSQGIPAWVATRRRGAPIDGTAARPAVPSAVAGRLRDGWRGAKTDRSPA